MGMAGQNAVMGHECMICMGGQGNTQDLRRD